MFFRYPLFVWCIGSNRAFHRPGQPVFSLLGPDGVQRQGGEFQAPLKLRLEPTSYEFPGIKGPAGDPREDVLTSQPQAGLERGKEKARSRTGFERLVGELLE